MKVHTRDFSRLYPNGMSFYKGDTSIETSLTPVTTLDHGK